MRPIFLNRHRMPTVVRDYWTLMAAAAAIGLFLLLSGCALLPKGATDKVADLAINGCVRTTETERVLLHSESNAKITSRCAEKAMATCPQVCISCDGTGTQCVWRPAP